MKKNGLKLNYARYKRFVVNNIAFYSQKPSLKAYLEILLSLSAIIIFAIFALRPTLIAIASLLKEIESRKEVISTLDEKKANLDKAIRLYNQEQDRIKLVNQAIPDNSKPDDSARQMEGALGENDVGLVNFGIGEATLLGENEIGQFSINSQPISNNLGELTINFEVEGNYQNLKKLTSDIENLRMILYLNGLEMINKKESPGGNLSVTVVGKFPFYITTEEKN